MGLRQHGTRQGVNFHPRGANFLTESKTLSRRLLWQFKAVTTFRQILLNR